MDESEKLLEGDIVLYRTAQGTARIEVINQAETFWLNQKKRTASSRRTQLLEVLE